MGRWRLSRQPAGDRGFVVWGRWAPIGAWLRDHATLGVGVFVTAFAVLAGLACCDLRAVGAAGWAFGMATARLPPWPVSGGLADRLWGFSGGAGDRLVK
jgi:hypothetical protein